MTNTGNMNSKSTTQAYSLSCKFAAFITFLVAFIGFRSHTIPLIMQSTSAKAIPLFLYCSECLDERQCSHHCCRIWLVHAYELCGIDFKSEGQLDLQSADNTKLMVLATVAS